MTAKYLLLFRDGMPKPEEMDDNVKEWDSWIGKIAQQGKFDSGLPFGPNAKVVSGPDGAVSDFVLKDNEIHGYIMIHADSLEEAVEIAKQAPNVLRGGSVEVRSTVPPVQ